jgi:hypothetical protein
MATVKKTKSEESQDLEIRKVKALESISNSLEDITAWLEDIDKDDWSSRIQFYLTEFLKIAQGKRNDEVDE